MQHPDKETMDQLYKEFKTIETRPGKAGQSYDYVKSSDVVDRLNKVFGLRWTVQELETRYEGDWVIKRVQIVVRDEQGKEYIKEGTGGHQYMNNIFPPDVHKSAFSKALTKAASLLGIGLYLYGLEEDEIENGQGQYAPRQAPALQPVQYAPPLAPVAPMPQPQPPDTQSQPMQPRPMQPQPMPQPAPPGGTIGYTQGPGTSAQASVTLPVQPMPGPRNFSEPQPQAAPAPMQTANMAPAPTNFQIMAVKAAAGLQQKDPMQLAFEILGQEISGLQYVEQLTGEQAQKILAELRAIEVAGTYN